MSRSKTLRWVKIFIAEVIGTSFLLIIGCLGCVDNFEYFKPSHITVSTGAGLALMIGINCFATISGAHFNPSVTLAALVCGMIDLVVSSGKSSHKYIELIYLLFLGNNIIPDCSDYWCTFWILCHKSSDFF